MNRRTDPIVPPLFTAVAVDRPIDPFDKAVALASLGCDAGTLVHNVMLDQLRAALVFSPEVALEDAMPVFLACGVGFANALGSLAPPEVAVHLEWSGGIRINGASCGKLRVRASTGNPDGEPAWLVVGLEIPLMILSESPGLTPDVTALFLEGCSEVDPVTLLEAWCRHTLVCVNRWFEDGNAPLHSEWRRKAHGMGESISLRYGGANVSGTFLGIDERFGMILRNGDQTRLLPLSGLLE